MNGYNFTERVRKVLAMAHEEAVRLQHGHVGTEHILLGLIREGEGVAATVLQNLNVELDALSRHVEEMVRRGKSSGPTRADLPYTSRAKLAFELSMKQARALDHRYVGTEHLLLGLVTETEGVAARVLAEVGVTADAVRAEVLKVLGVSEPAPKPEPLPSYEELSALRGRSVERVEVILYYRDGHRYQGSFTSAQDAAGFLMWTRRG